MFRLECFVEDKNLAAVMRAVSGKVKDLNVVPVPNLMVQDGQLKSTGSTLDLLIAFIDKHDIKMMTAQHARTFMEEIGRPPAGYYGLLKNAIDAGVLRPGAKQDGTNAKTYAVVSKQRLLAAAKKRAEA